MSLKGVVFKFQRHSLHDGPGIRTLVFFKGCPLRCRWCFNPESQEKRAEVIHYPERCIGCNLCLKACPIEGAIQDRAGKKSIDRHRCDNCGRCAEACLTGGMTKMGLLLDADEVVDVVRKDRVFYDRSGGGVTLSGGEVTYQSEFACEILSRCKALGIHTAFETCGYTSWDHLERLLNHTDLVLYDLKVMDEEKHLAFTGVHIAVILENARRMARSETPMVIRIPVIPGYTDARSDLEHTAEFIRSELRTIEGVHLLPYETVGVAKYERLGREYTLEEVEPPSDGYLAAVKKIFEGCGLRVQVRG